MQKHSLSIFFRYIIVRSITFKINEWVMCSALAENIEFIYIMFLGIMSSKGIGEAYQIYFSEDVLKVAWLFIL